MDRFDTILHFANQHSEEDPLTLLLHKKRYSDIDLGLVAQQLEGRKQARTKWPSLSERDTFFFPSKLNREQSSSEATARYKARIIESLQPDSLADLTGGMGIDLLFAAPHAKSADYFETDPILCDIARHNFAALGLTHITCHNTDSLSHLSAHPAHYSLLFIDPARRNSQGRRVAAFEDCTPDLIAHLPLLLSHCDRLLVKASPMIDLSHALTQLGSVAEIHIVAVGNECKEVLFLSGNAPEPVIHCSNITSTGTSHITFTPSDESQTQCLYTTENGTYLYEPNAALMKGGCHNTLSKRYSLYKLARNTHLYTSNSFVADFPGRKFEILQPLQLNSKSVRKTLPEGKAHVVTRNYPMAATDLQRHLKLHEGGDLFVIAATLGTRPQGWLCRRVDDTPFITP